MWIDQRGSEVLPRNECLRLLALAAGGFGRVGTVDSSGNVLIHPVNYRMVDQDVLIQVGAGTVLDAALDASIMSFEIDSLSEAEGEAWSVLVHGLATVVREGETLGRVRPTGGAPLVPEPGTFHVRIRTGVVSGRRFALRPPSG